MEGEWRVTATISSVTWSTYIWRENGGRGVEGTQIRCFQLSTSTQVCKCLTSTTNLQLVSVGDTYLSEALLCKVTVECIELCLGTYNA